MPCPQKESETSQSDLISKEFQSAFFRTGLHERLSFPPFQTSSEPEGPETFTPSLKCTPWSLEAKLYEHPYLPNPPRWKNSFQTPRASEATWSGSRHPGAPGQPWVSTCGRRPPPLPASCRAGGSRRAHLGGSAELRVADRTRRSAL